MENQDLVEDILSCLHRIKVMLWASDYRAAEIELNKLGENYDDLLSQVNEREAGILKKKREFDTKLSASKKRNLRYAGIKGANLEYELDISRADVIRNTNTGQQQDASAISERFAFLALSRSISRYAKQIEDARSLPKSNSYGSLNRDISGRYRAYEERLGVGIVNYRVYRLDMGLHSVSQLIQQIGQKLDSNPVQVDKGDDELPISVRFFGKNTFTEIALLDSERFTVTITYSQNEPPIEIFDMIVGTILDFIDPNEMESL